MHQNEKFVIILWGKLDNILTSTSVFPVFVRLPHASYHGLFANGSG